jgi:hypothetical protein
MKTKPRGACGAGTHLGSTLHVILYYNLKNNINIPHGWYLVYHLRDTVNPLLQPRTTVDFGERTVSLTGRRRSNVKEYK